MPPQHHAGVWLASGMLLFFLVRRVAGLQRRQIAMCHGTAAGEAARPLSKVHHATVALVPPEECWPPIQEARLELRDRGIYRWPPHINLLYPFAPADEMALALARLAPAAAALPPFELDLDQLGTFGGRRRGVLWAAPSDAAQLGRLVELQAALQAAAPEFDDQQRVGGGGFVPHMTLSHFDSLDEAEAARAALAPRWRPIRFTLGGGAAGQTAVHLMWRDGGSGQFKRAASLPLGVAPDAPLPPLLDPPHCFPQMPEEEEAWVVEARKAAAKGRKGRRRRSPRRSPEERAAVAARTPEEIAAIRAARAAARREADPSA